MVAATVLATLLEGNFCHAGRQWNNPENQRRYIETQRRSAEAHRQAASAWGNYDRELGRAQKDVRRVRDQAIEGARRGRPGAPPKDRPSGTYGRGRDFYKIRRR